VKWSCFVTRISKQDDRCSSPNFRHKEYYHKTHGIGKSQKVWDSGRSKLRGRSKIPALTRNQDNFWKPLDALDEPVVLRQEQRSLPLETLLPAIEATKELRAGWSSRLYRTNAEFGALAGLGLDMRQSRSQEGVTEHFPLEWGAAYAA